MPITFLSFELEDEYGRGIQSINFNDIEAGSQDVMNLKAHNKGVDEYTITIEPGENHEEQIGDAVETYGSTYFSLDGASWSTSLEIVMAGGAEEDFIIKWQPPSNSNVGTKVWAVDVSGFSFMPGWDYKTTFDVINTTDEDLTDISVPVTIPYTVDKMKTDFGDIRFYIEDEEIPYHLYSKTDEDEALFYLFFATLDAYETKTIYVYSGNSGATTTSSPEDAYLFYDDFTGASIDTDKWSVDANGVWSIEDNQLKASGTTAGKYMRIKVDGSPLDIDDVVLECTLKSSAANDGVGIFVRGAETNPHKNCYMMFPTVYNGDDWYLIKKTNDSNGVIIKSGSFNAANTYTIRMESLEHYHSIYVDDTQIGSSYHDSSYLTGYLGVIGFGSSITAYYDNILVKKNLETPPTVEELNEWQAMVESVNIDTAGRIMYNSLDLPELDIPARVNIIIGSNRYE